MRAAGATVLHVGEVVPYGSPVEYRLTDIGRRGWIALLRDQAVRRRPLEREALKSARVARVL